MNRGGAETLRMNNITEKVIGHVSRFIGLLGLDCLNRLMRNVCVMS